MIYQKAFLKRKEVNIFRDFLSEQHILIVPKKREKGQNLQFLFLQHIFARKPVKK